MPDVLTHPGASPSCPRCLGLGLVIGQDGLVARARTCDCVGRCPACDGTGWTTTAPAGAPLVDQLRAARRRCTCRLIDQRAQCFDAAGIPARYAHATLASFEPQKASMAAFIAANKYVQDYRPGQDNRGLVLWGAVGRGKTHLLIGVLRELVLRYGVRVRFVEFSHLLGDLKASFERRQGAGELLEPLSRVDVLAIDELGKGRNTEFEGTVLDELVSRRYNALGTILATTNYQPAPATGHATPSLAQPGDDLPTLSDRVGDRVFSRLRETSWFVEVKGEDYREVKRSRPVAR